MDKSKLPSQSEQPSAKLREVLAALALTRDRIAQLELQRDGMESSLTGQITLYKKMLAEAEQKNQVRMAQVQKAVAEDMLKLQRAREKADEEHKLEKDMLERRICQLEETIAQQKGNISDKDQANLNLNSQVKQLQSKVNQTQASLAQAQIKIQQEVKRAAERESTLQGELTAQNNQWTAKQQALLRQKQAEKDQIRAQNKIEAKQAENRARQVQAKSQEQIKALNELVKQESEKGRKLIEDKDTQIRKITQTVSDLKSQILLQEKETQCRTSQLRGQNQQLMETIADMKLQLSSMDQQTRSLQLERESMLRNISSLQSDLEMSQVNYVTERQSKYQLHGEMTREFERQNAAYEKLKCERMALLDEVQLLKGLLRESAIEMERCKQEFLRLQSLRAIKGRTNDTILKLRDENRNYFAR